MAYFVYILKCADGTFYTGITTDTKRRLEEHNSKKGAKYTRSRVPVTMVYKERAEDKNSALKREYRIKQMTKKQKEALIQGEDKEK